VSWAATVEPLRVRTLGGFAVWRGATPIPPGAWSGRRATALFKCLLSMPGHRLHREQLMEALWPEAEPDAGATNLRTTIHLLRQILDDPRGASSYLRAEGDVLALTPAGAAAPPDDWLDATAFAHAAHVALAGQDAAACRAALACYEGVYLPDDPYAAWAEQPRASLRHQYLDLLLHLATLSAVQGELQEAEDCLRRVLAAEPSHEGAAATLMGVLAAAGRRSDALHVYQTVATVLEEELDVAPAAEITALRVQLLAQEAAPLAARVPPREVSATRLTNLPVALTSFVGRAWEVAAVTAALSAARVVTLTGPGGCGKTRLALEVADRWVEASPDGVWLVELAGLADPALVPRAVAGALGVVEQAGRPLIETLRDFLHSRHLLVLDNCEHLIVACAELVTLLLQTCPHLRVLATSREALAVAGEQTYRTPSLTMPDPDHLPPLERLPAYEAVQLFLERAQARRPELTLTAANAGAVAQICARLDGLPLAIELAAARVVALPVEGIAARLADRFGLLTGGPRRALPRQQTLRATLDWSYALLAAPEQVLLRRLAVFAGGWTLEGAEAVCTGGEVAAGAVLDLLAGLVHKSLVQMDERGGASRYRLLETIRQYARERMAVSGETALVQRRHAASYLTLVERAELEITGPDQLRWLDLLEREHDNLRAALAWCLDRHAPAQGEEDALALETGLRLAGGLHWFWHFRDQSREGLAWLERALAQAPAAPAAERAKALSSAGILAGLYGADLVRSQALLTDSVALSRADGDRQQLSVALSRLGWAMGQRGQDEQAAAVLEESLALARAAGDPWLIAHALLHGLMRVAGSAAIERTEERARAWAAGTESLARFQAVGDPIHIAGVQMSLGQLALHDGDYARARTALGASLPLFRALGWQSTVADVLVSLADVAREQGAYQEATALYTESMTLYRHLGDRLLVAPIAAVLSRLAAIALEMGDWPVAQTHVTESLVIAQDTDQVGAPELAGVLEVGAVLAAAQGAI
jgi:predicted ATPase/DNA-binding SARP family transcriptional activator